MKKTKALSVVLILLAAGLLVDMGLAQGIRKPVWAGQFYAADPSRLAYLIDIIFWRLILLPFRARLLVSLHLMLVTFTPVKLQPMAINWLEILILQQ